MHTYGMEISVQRRRILIADDKEDAAAPPAGYSSSPSPDGQIGRTKHVHASPALIVI